MKGMIIDMRDIVVVRGAGDIATGVISLLHRCGFQVVALEISQPSAIRRSVSLSEAVYDGVATVENVTARLCGISDYEAVLERRQVPLLIDPDMSYLSALRPVAVVDATLAKRNLGLTLNAAPVTIGLGPGFKAGLDCRAVIETNRGHRLGRIIYEGEAERNTGIPAPVRGYGSERVIHAPVDGRLRVIRDIGALVQRGEVLAELDGTPVLAAISGVLRGMLRNGYAVRKGMKMADIDPRVEEVENCSTISDKARCIAGGVLGALLEAGL